MAGERDPAAAATALVQFSDTKELLFENEYTCHRYTFDARQQFERFKRAAKYFVGYLVHYRTVDRMFAQYRVHWLVFVSRVLRLYGHRHQSIGGDLSVERFVELSVADVHERLGLEPHAFTPADGYKNVWGNRYWDFLHATAFCVDGDAALTRSFAYLMLNFHLVLVCGACYQNFKRKDPLRTVTVPMRETLDPVTVVYDLHNAVNAEIGNRHLSLREFCDQQQCTVTETYTHNYKTIVKY